MVIKRLLRLCCFIVVILFLFPACGNVSQAAPDVLPGSAETTPIDSNTIQEYPLPQANSGLMRPAIDQQDRLWFGEMGHNFLTSFDPQTQTFQQITPPRGQAGIMGVAVDTDDTIWVAEQYANYIGHYNPEKHTWQIYPLPTIQAPGSNQQTLPVAPNDIALDARGNVWFTELNNDAIGMLNRQTGTFKHYQIGAKKTVQVINPYGITVDPQGMVWFTESSSNHLGRLDPTNGNMRIFTTQNKTDALMEVTHDGHGNIWATGFTNGLLLRCDEKTGQLISYHAPGNKPGAIYGIAAAPTGELWMTVPTHNAIARFDPTSGHFTYYPLPSENAFPLGLITDKKQAIWFTEAGSNKLGELHP